METKFFKKQEVEVEASRIEKGEEPLYEAITPIQGIGKKRFVAGFDGGSTQSRCLIIDDFENPDLEDVKIIPSAVRKATDDREIPSVGRELINCLDSSIVDLTNRANSMISSARLLRGRKASDSTFPEMRLTSFTKKIDEEVFYLNIIDTLGYATMMKYAEDVPEEVDVYLGVALPPEDRAVSTLENKFINRLIGQYKWVNAEYGVCMKINIKEVVTDTESASQGKAYYLAVDEVMPANVISFMTGGRSGGVDYLAGGHSKGSAGITVKSGGRKLIQQLGKKLVASENCPINKELSESVLADALITGVVKQGKTGRIDIVDELKELFSETAVTYMGILKNEVLNAAEVDLSSVEEIILSGRLFGRGEYDCSIADYLVALIKQESPETEVRVCEENYIPLGLAFLAYTTFGGYLEETEEEVAADSEKENFGL